MYQTTVTVGDKLAEMTVLVKKGLTQPLLGRDLSGFYQLVVDAIGRGDNTQTEIHSPIQDDAPVLVDRLDSKKSSKTPQGQLMIWHLSHQEQFPVI